MKKLKSPLIYVSLMILLTLASCSTEQTLLETDIADTLLEENTKYGIVDDIYTYSDIYCDQFNYYQNGIKLTNPVEINKMLSNALNVYHEKENISIVLSKNEDENFLKNNKQFAVNEETNMAMRNGHNKVYYYLANKYQKMHGGGSRHYGTFRPTYLRFGNLTNVLKRVTLYKNVNGQGSVYKRYLLYKNQKIHVGVGGNTGNIYSHVVW